MGDDLKIVRDWLLKLPDLDLEDIVADGGVTSGMVVQQEAALMASKLSAILARAQGPGPGEAVEACVVDIKAGLCCPRIHGCEQNDDDQYCLVRQAFIRAGLLPDPDAALLQGRLE